jgi:hypothetical protein
MIASGYSLFWRSMMRPRIIDLRVDEDTAAHISDALQMQMQYGYDYACDHLQSLGVPPQVAQRLLAIRYDRRLGEPCEARAAA